MIVALRAPSLAKFGEVDTVPVSEKCDNPRMILIVIICMGIHKTQGRLGPSALSTFRPLGYPIKP